MTVAKPHPSAASAALPVAGFAPCSAAQRRVVSAILGLFFFTTLVVPAAFVNKLLFLVLGMWLLKDMLFARKPRVTLVASPLVVLVIFTYGLFASLMSRSDVGLGIQFFLSVFILFLIHLVDRYRIDIDRLAEGAGIVLLAFTGLYLLVTLLPDLPLAEPLSELFQKVSLSAQGDREFSDEPTFSLRIGPVSFLFLPWCLFARRYFDSHRLRDLGLLLATGAGIVLSASRGLFVISLVFLVVVALRKLSLLARIAAAIATGVAVYLVFEFYLGNTMILSAQETSNAVKIGHFRSYFDDVTPISALFGRGLASYYYSTGSVAMKAHTEITPLDMMRYFGVPLTCVLYFFIMFPARGLSRYVGSNGIHVFAFVLYLALSVTNPVMFNSYGMLVVLWYWAKIRGGSTPAGQPAGRTPV